MQFIRDPAKVHAALQQMPDGRVIAVKPCKIYSPVRYVERNLSYVGSNVHILGIYGITVEDKYLGVSMLNTMLQIEPSSISKLKMQGDDYYEFVFVAGATVFKTVTLVRTDTLVYRIYDEFIAKGYVPWYVNYEDMGRIFDSAKVFADANIGQNPEVTQLIASIVARDSKDRTKYFRTSVKTREDLDKIQPAFVPLKSVEYSATNTLTKLGGSFFGKGVVSSLINPSTRPERLESIILQ
jgi:hypothetical protein